MAEIKGAFIISGRDGRPDGEVLGEAGEKIMGFFRQAGLNVTTQIIKRPEPYDLLAIVPRDKGDIDKVRERLVKLCTAPEGTAPTNVTAVIGPTQPHRDDDNGVILMTAPLYLEAWANKIFVPQQQTGAREALVAVLT